VARVVSNLAGSVARALRLDNRVFVISGGAGLLGAEHALAIAEAGGTAILGDIRMTAVEERARELGRSFAGKVFALKLDVTDEVSCREALGAVLGRLNRVDGLVNNAARNPTVTDCMPGGGLENFPVDEWRSDMEVGITGAFICSKVFGAEMARRGSGVIVNIASDLGIVAPDQRIYRYDQNRDASPFKPPSYSVAKAGLLMLTKYLATYYAGKGVRVNALSPGGVAAEQPAEFVRNLVNLIPLGRMASKDEFRAALVFLCSDASSYMTGANLVIDGGRTSW
jgi:NAD(P)-dependent dehydrogenase (short-subunit alcohol dehydrogenase family)